MLFQVLCGFEPIFYTTHPNEEPLKFEDCYNKEKALIEWIKVNKIKVLNSGIKIA